MAMLFEVSRQGERDALVIVSDQLAAQPLPEIGGHQTVNSWHQSICCLPYTSFNALIDSDFLQIFVKTRQRPEAFQPGLLAPLDGRLTVWAQNLDAPAGIQRVDKTETAITSRKGLCGFSKLAFHLVRVADRLRRVGR